MAIRSRNILKSFFELNDYPTAEQFGDLIDSFFHKTEDSVNIPTYVGAPAGPTATGVLGQQARDSEFLYVCYATNQWGRIRMTKDWET